MHHGPRNLRITADGVGLTQFAGVSLIEHFFQRLGLRGAFADHIRFPQRNNRYSISESLEALLYPRVLGLGRIDTTEPLRHNGVFHYLAGLPGYPEATSLRRFLDRFARRGRNSLVKLHDTWRAAMRGQPSQAIFDLDSTVLTVYGRQERAEVGYNPKKRGRPSYLPLLCFEGNTRIVGRAATTPAILTFRPLRFLCWNAPSPSCQSPFEKCEFEPTRRSSITKSCD